MFIVNESNLPRILNVSQGVVRAHSNPAKAADGKRLYRLEIDTEDADAVRDSFGGFLAGLRWNESGKWSWYEQVVRPPIIGRGPAVACALCAAPVPYE